MIYRALSFVESGEADERVLAESPGFAEGCGDLAEAAGVLRHVAAPEEVGCVEFLEFRLIAELLHELLHVDLLVV